MFFCTGDTCAGAGYVIDAYMITQKELVSCEPVLDVCYAAGIVMMMEEHFSDPGRGLLRTCYYAAPYVKVSMHEIRRELLRILSPANVVYSELPIVTCLCTGHGHCPCWVIRELPASSPISVTHEEAAGCCMDCVSTLEFMLFRHEIYIHCGGQPV